MIADTARFASWDSRPSRGARCEVRGSNAQAAAPPPSQAHRQSLPSIHVSAAAPRPLKTAMLPQESQPDGEVSLGTSEQGMHVPRLQKAVAKELVEDFDIPTL